MPVTVKKKFLHECDLPEITGEGEYIFVCPEPYNCEWRGSGWGEGRVTWYNDKRWFEWREVEVLTEEELTAQRLAERGEQPESWWQRMFGG